MHTQPLRKTASVYANYGLQENGYPATAWNDPPHGRLPWRHPMQTEHRRPPLLPTPPQTQQPPTTNKKHEPINELTDMLSTLLTRMDRLEGLMTTKSRPPNNTSTQHRSKTQNQIPTRRARTQKPPSPPTEKSNNPQFPELWRTIFKAVQIKHHLNNWKETPSSIRKNLEDLTERINPPVPCQNTKKAIEQITKEAGERIRDAIEDHLTLKLASTRSHLHTLNPTDHEKAKTIATKHLKNRVGRKMDTKLLDLMIAEEMSHLNLPPNNNNNDTTAPPPTPSTNNDNPWREVAKRPGKRQRDESRSPPTFSVASRFEPIAMEEEETENADTEDPKKPRRKLIRPKNAGLHVLPETTKTLVITDSCFRPIPEQHVPDEWLLSITPGLKIREATMMVAHELKNPRVHTIIVSVGINNRDDTHKNIEKDLDHLQRMTEVATSKGVEIFFNTIAYNKDNLTILEEITIEALIKKIQDCLGPNRILPTIPPEEVRTKPDGIHPTPDSMAAIWAKMIQAVAGKRARNSRPLA